MSKFFALFILILMALLGVIGFWYWQGNRYSKEILKLEILGPEAVQAGDEVEYLVKFKNNGKLRLEEPELIFEYPQNSITKESQPQRITQKINDIYPGEERMVSFKALLFGKEEDILKAQSWITYRPKNLKARYESNTNFITKIKAVPITLEFDLPLKTEQEEIFQFSVNYFSNINYPLENLRMKLEYPEGFHFLSSQPRALDETEWSLPSLSPVDGGRINIKGTLDGAEGKKKIFRAQLGIIKDEGFIPLKETFQTIEIAEPSFYISQLINGSREYLANVGDLLHYEIFFKNIGKKPIQKKFLLLKLEGGFFDLETLKSESGEIGKGDNSVLWDWKDVTSLQFLDADEEGKIEFWVKVKDGSQERKTINPVLKNKVSIGGTEKVFDTKINSKVWLSQKVDFEEDVFGNSGPIPPQIGASTTYTVFWQVKNNWNDLQNVKVKSILPAVVKPTGKIFPEAAKFTFDSQSREIIWNIGELKAFQGTGDAPFTLAFQIEFNPLLPPDYANQEAITFLLMGEAEFLGQDSFTSELIQEKAKGVEATVVNING